MQNSLWFVNIAGDEGHAITSFNIVCGVSILSAMRAMPSPASILTMSQLWTLIIRICVVSWTPFIWKMRGGEFGNYSFKLSVIFRGEWVNHFLMNSNSTEHCSIIDFTNALSNGYLEIRCQKDIKSTVCVFLLQCSRITHAKICQIIV